MRTSPSKNNNKRKLSMTDQTAMMLQAIKAAAGGAGSAGVGTDTGQGKGKGKGKGAMGLQDSASKETGASKAVLKPGATPLALAFHLCNPRIVFCCIYIYIYIYIYLFITYLFI